ncbi:heavy metal transporter [Homoserinibacter sp. YIM 151385]|uniref:heavy metal transporter n=1 Tax=Homoserinibacter sp. YIM 151385 TaxID=2985506 RepID=UPI0022F11F5A|nr:heavy metal transporter [Homoserinibacter sp. YIM 151385]WBU38509.1 heavy metal transporter [Homoserinibacter sp. YIM 151385]
MTGDPAPGRTRVTAPDGERTADSGLPAHDDDAVYTASLRRAQLRLGISVALGFLATGISASLFIALWPGIHEIRPGGVPLDWLLQAYGLYPVVLAWGVAFAVGAERNERRWRALSVRA